MPIFKINWNMKQNTPCYVVGWKRSVKVRVSSQEGEIILDDLDGPAYATVVLKSSKARSQQGFLKHRRGWNVFAQSNWVRNKEIKLKNKQTQHVSNL